MTRAAVLLACLLQLACAREFEPAAGPASAVPGRGDAELPLSKRYAHGPGRLSLEIPEGASCLDWLAARGVAFRPLEPTPGMRTPVEIVGAIDGIRFESAGAPVLVCDCRLAVALLWIAPELHGFGVTEVHHSGAYVYRTTRNGKPSLHAEGLAIDVHELRLARTRLEVGKDFERGARCAGGVPPLNRLACDLSRTGLFREVITPDDDSDHRDHLHLAIAPL